MSFTRRYLAWLIGPPAIITGSLSFLFLAQVLQFSMSTAVRLLVVVLALFIVGAFAVSAVLAPRTRAVEAAVAGQGDLAAALTDCLVATKRVTVVVWAIGGLTFAILGTLLILRSALGFSYFLVAALICGFASVTWGYASGKYLLSEAAAGRPNVQYTGREFSLGRKIAIVFIGSFLVSSIVLVQLVSSKVSTALEGL
ncbi:MAG: hypothetical protein ACXV7D_04665, partial [Thermoanaerobaculia bacterium]